MIERCTNPRNRHFQNYGGRGISVCEKWKKFKGFYADVGDPPKGKSLDRIDNNMGYELSNVRWATRKQQARNTRTNIFLTFNGRTACIPEWSEITGFAVTTIRARIDHGWSVDDALTLPVHSRGRHRGAKP